MNGTSVPLIALPIDLLLALLDDIEASAPAGAEYLCILSEPLGQRRLYKVFTGPGPAGPWAHFDDYDEDPIGLRPLLPATSARGGNDNQP